MNASLSDRHLRVDLRIDGRTLRNVRVQGAGGPICNPGGLQRLRNVLSSPLKPVRIILTWTAESETWLDTLAKSVTVLGESKPILFRLGRNRPKAVGS